MTRRVLVARLDAAGDVLLAGPAIRAIAARADEVWLLCGPRGAEAAALLPGVDELRVWSSPWIDHPAPAADGRAMRALRAILRECRPDEAVILTSDHQSPLPLALCLREAGVPLIAGASVDYAGSLLDVRLRPGEDFPEEVPEPVRALHIAAAAGFPLPAGDDGLLRIAEPGEPLEPADVVVHPGGAAPARRASAGLLAEVVARLAARGLRVAVTGGPDERALTARVAGSHGIDLGGRTSLRGLAAQLRAARAVVVGNTAAAHLAAAVGTPVVSLFSPVVPAARWAPYGVPVELLGDQAAPCRLSRARACPIPGHPCLDDLRPDDVVAACQRLAAAAPGRATEEARA